MVIRSLGLVASFGIVAGCYSTPAVDPYPRNWLIDDFELDDGYPRAPGFAKWGCRPEEGPHRISHCEVAEDLGYFRAPRSENRMLYLGSTLEPPADGIDEFTRAEVATSIEVPQDLAAYEGVSFKARLDWQHGTAPNLKIQLLCPRVGAADGGISPNPCVLADREVGAQDGTYTWPTNEYVKLSDLKPPSAQERTGGAVNRNDCLAKIQGIKITVDANYPSADTSDRQALDFQLYIDDLEFIPKARRQ